MILVPLLLGLAVVTVAFLDPEERRQSAAAPTLEPGIKEVLMRLNVTATATPEPRPTPRPRPSRQPDDLAMPTVVAPTPPAGGLSAALRPAERSVGSFEDRSRLPSFGRRDLPVGWLEDTHYIAGMRFSLDQIPPESELTYAALELAGFSDLSFAGRGTWVVEQLQEDTAEAWSDLTFETLFAANGLGGRTWRLEAKDLAPRRYSVLEFGDQALAGLAGQLRGGGEWVAFRIVGPERDDEGDNVFAWDSGYGPGFGARPTLRINFVPPPPTPGPEPGQATPEPLVLWEAEPTPAPTPTPLPAVAPVELSGKVLFLSDRFGPRPQLMVVDPTSGRVGRVTRPWPYEQAKERQRVAGNLSVAVQGVPCGSGGPTILVDGDPVPNPDPARRCTQVVILEPGREPREITPPGHLHYDPVLSPDGGWVAYTSQLMSSDDVFKIRVDGSESQRLTENEWEWDKHPSWSPDGSQVVFWSNRSGRQQLYVVPAIGGEARPLAESAHNDWDPVWVR